MRKYYRTQLNKDKNRAKKWRGFYYALGTAFKRPNYPSARDIKGRTRYWSEPDIKNAGGSTDTLIEVNKMYLAVIKSGKKVTSR